MNRKDEWYSTIFGDKFEVIIYPERAQYKGHISLLVNPQDVDIIKKILQGEYDLLLTTKIALKRK